LDRVRALLPSKCLHPVRITPWYSIVHIAAFSSVLATLVPTTS
jgi:hypothetical protein